MYQLTLSIENNKNYKLLKSLNNNDNVFNHLIDCTNILIDIYKDNYEDYIAPVMLHDIGKFIDKNNYKKHPSVAYEYLLNNYTNDSCILLPIKYHENDLDWRELIKNEPLYIESKEKEKIEFLCTLVRDIDIISNMKKLDHEYSKENIELNIELVSLLENKKISQTINIENDYDKILYILCGLSLIENNECLEYIKENNIVKKLLLRLDEIDNRYTDKISNIIYEEYNL